MHVIMLYLVCNDISYPSLYFSGTFVCGLTVLCGARIRFKDSTKQKLILTNTSVAFLQLVTAFLFLLGWIWSIVWGVAFITISSRYFLKQENMLIQQAFVKIILNHKNVRRFYCLNIFLEVYN